MGQPRDGEFEKKEKKAGHQASRPWKRGAGRESPRFVSSCGKILIGKIHVNINGFGGKHRHKPHLVATAPAFRQDHSSSYGDQMRHAVGIVVDPINTSARSNNTRHKMRR